MNASEKRAALAGAIRDGRFVVALGVYDMVSAKIADGMGFGAFGEFSPGTDRRRRNSAWLPSWRSKSARSVRHASARATLS